MERYGESRQSEGIPSFATLHLEEMTDGEKLQLKLAVDEIKSVLDNSPDVIIKKHLSRFVSSRNKSIRTIIGIVVRYLSSPERSEENKAQLMDNLRALSDKLPSNDPGRTITG